MYPAGALRELGAATGQALRHPLRVLRRLARVGAAFRRRPIDLGKTLMVWWRTQGVLPWVAAMRPDHVHAHYATYPSTAALLINEALGIPFSFTAHAHDVFGAPHLLDEKFERAAFVATISEFNKGWFRAACGSPRTADVQVVHCGVPLQRFPFRPQGRTAGAIVGTGWLHEVKGWRYLIDACALLASRGIDFTCDIISDGPDRPTLESQIERLGLSSRVHLLGALPQEALRDHLYRAGVFVLPCVPTTTREIMDGIPVALMEAMATGAPVVSTAISGIPELVQDGVTGLLAPPRDAAALARCVERIVTNPALAQSLAVNARRHVEQQFDVRSETGKLYDLLTEAHNLAGQKRVA